MVEREKRNVDIRSVKGSECLYWGLTNQIYLLLISLCVSLVIYSYFFNSLQMQSCRL